MATSDSNMLTFGYSGKIGNMILRHFGGRSVLSKAPDFENVKWSKAQKANRKRFSQAMQWARKAMNDPELREFYKKKAKRNQTAWNAAVSDFMIRPEISEIDTNEYRGQAGDTIRIRAFDKFRVTAVIVTILTSQGYEVESGMAVQMWDGQWMYEAKEVNPGWKEGRIAVVAYDNPGHFVKSEVRIRNLRYRS